MEFMEELRILLFKLFQTGWHLPQTCDLSIGVNYFWLSADCQHVVILAESRSFPMPICAVYIYQQFPTAPEAWQIIGLCGFLCNNPLKESPVYINLSTLEQSWIISGKTVTAPRTPYPHHPGQNLKSEPIDWFTCLLMRMSGKWVRGAEVHQQLPHLCASPFIFRYIPRAWK